MENIFLDAFVISVIYILIIFLEMRYNQKEDKQFKDVFKEGLMVYLSVISGIFILNQFKPEVEKMMNEAPPLVFVDNPPF
jgi:hypothetical protein